MADAAQAFLATIRSVLGYAPDTIVPGRLHRFGTNGRPGDTAGWCRLHADQRRGVFGCFRQNVREVWSADAWTALSKTQRAARVRFDHHAAADRERTQAQQWDENAKRIRHLRQSLVPLTHDDPVTRYLNRRGLTGAMPLPSVLRLHPCLDYWHDGVRLGRYPAMVAPVTAPDGKVLALHRTYLSDDGHKADVPAVKKLTVAAGSLTGACIALHQPVRGCIGIAEGIETALAAWRGSGVPTVAAYCARNLAAWQWPAGVQRVVVFADADGAGRTAAEALRARLRAAGKLCDVLMPSTEGADWCDVWVGRLQIEDVQ